MKQAIAIWNYCWNAEALPGWIRTFASAGFDAIRFHPKPFAGDAIRHLGPAVRALEECQLDATLHGAVVTEPDLMRALVDGLGSRLLTVTLDGARREDSRGWLHDAAASRTALACLQDWTEGSRIRLAIEDFGMGTAPIGDVASALVAIGFNGVATIEIAPSLHGSKPEASLPRALESFDRWHVMLREADTTKSGRHCVSLHSDSTPVPSAVAAGSRGGDIRGRQG